MNDEQLSTLAQLRAFVEGTVTIDFTVATDERYAFIARTVKRFGYSVLFTTAVDIINSLSAAQVHGNLKREIRCQAGFRRIA